MRDPDALARWLGPGTPIIRHQGGAKANIAVLDSEARIPWSGHTAGTPSARSMTPSARRKMSLVFVNTRSQAEMTFQELWRVNEDALPIALHHGSLDVEQRRKVEAAMADGKLKAVVCTSTLDLGIDWGDVDLVVQMGAPKGSSRLIQRIGRSNHRMDEPSRALLCAVQPLRGAGMPRGGRGGGRRRAGRAGAAARRRSTCWRSTSWAGPAATGSMR